MQVVPCLPCNSFSWVACGILPVKSDYSIFFLLQFHHQSGLAQRVHVQMLSVINSHMCNVLMCMDVSERLYGLLADL